MCRTSTLTVPSRIPSNTSFAVASRAIRGGSSPANPAVVDRPSPVVEAAPDLPKPLQPDQAGKVGFVFTDLSAEQANTARVQGGVMVQAVSPDSPAARGGLVAGDVITAGNSAGGQPPNVRFQSTLRPFGPASTPATFTVPAVGSYTTLPVLVAVPPFGPVRLVVLFNTLPLPSPTYTPFCVQVFPFGPVNTVVSVNVFPLICPVRTPVDEFPPAPTTLTVPVTAPVRGFTINCACSVNTV